MSEERNCLVDHGNIPCNCFRHVAVEHECKWKSLAGDLLRCLSAIDEKRPIAKSEVDIVLGKARSMMGEK